MPTNSHDSESRSKTARKRTILWKLRWIRQCYLDYISPVYSRTSYVLGLSRSTSQRLTDYEVMYSNDPFSESTIAAGEELMALLSEVSQGKWMKLVESIDMTHSSKKAWGTLRKLINHLPEATQPGPITANQLAHQLLFNRKPPNKLPSGFQLVSWKYRGTTTAQ